VRRPSDLANSRADQAILDAQNRPDIEQEKRDELQSEREEEQKLAEAKAEMNRLEEEEEELILKIAATMQSKMESSAKVLEDSDEELKMMEYLKSVLKET